MRPGWTHFQHNCHYHHRAQRERVIRMWRRQHHKVLGGIQQRQQVNAGETVGKAQFHLLWKSYLQLGTFETELIIHVDASPFSILTPPQLCQSPGRRDVTSPGSLTLVVTKIRRVRTYCYACAAILPCSDTLGCEMCSWHTYIHLCFNQ